MPKHIKKGESFKLNCTVCGKPAYIDPDTIQVMEDIHKIYGIIVCTDPKFGNKMILDGTLPEQEPHIIL